MQIVAEDTLSDIKVAEVNYGIFSGTLMLRNPIRNEVYNHHIILVCSTVNRTCIYSCKKSKLLRKAALEEYLANVRIPLEECRHESDEIQPYHKVVIEPISFYIMLLSWSFGYVFSLISTLMAALNFCHRKVTQHIRYAVYFSCNICTDQTYYMFRRCCTRYLHIWNLFATVGGVLTMIFWSTSVLETPLGLSEGGPAAHSSVYGFSFTFV